MIDLTINGEAKSLDVDPNTPLLWVLREHLGLTGTRYGCGMGLCGACTVHFNGGALRSCVMPLSACAGSSIVTIEGLDHRVQKVWIDMAVPQCGYCQSGQIMAAAALLTEKPNATDAEIEEGMTNLCRCATYHRIKGAIRACAQGA
jgi:aerobic-type carbon monoxide dehydrogenase small subunit (CoxS/CutS family)